MSGVGGSHSFGGRALDRYVFEYEAEEVGGADSYDAAEAAVVSGADDAAADTGGEALSTDEPQFGQEELAETVEYVRGLRSTIDEVGLAQQQAELAQALEESLDPTSVDYDPELVADLARHLLAGGGMPAASPEGAPLPEGAGGGDAWETERVFAAEEGQAKWDRATATAQLGDLLGKIGSGLDPAAVQVRATALLEPLRESTGATGGDLVAAAVRQAELDLSPTDDYDLALKRATRAAELGLPPLEKSSRPARLSDAERARASGEPQGSDDYDEVLEQMTGNR